MAGAQPELYRQAYQEMFEAATPIMEFSTAYEAEQAISMLLGGVYLHVVDGDRRTVLTTFVDEFVKFLQRRRTPQALAVLAGLSAVAPGVGGERAGKAVQRLCDRDLQGPTWVRHVGTVRCTSALVIRDAYGDQSQYLLTYGYDDTESGGPEHATAVLVDHNRRMVIDLSVVSPAQPVVARFQQAVEATAGHMSMAPIEPALARAEVEWYLLRTEQLTAQPSQLFLDAWALVAARLGRLPDVPGVVVAPSPLDDVAREAVVSAFLASDEARQLVREMGSRVDYPIEVIQDAIRLALDYAVEANSGDPLRWSPAAVVDMLLEWAPKRSEMPTDVRSWLPEVLEAFSGYAGRKRGLSSQALLATRMAITQSTQEYTNRMLDDPDGEAIDVVFRRMVADGVDPADEEASRRWLADYLDSRQRGQHPHPSAQNSKP